MKKILIVLCVLFVVQVLAISFDNLIIEALPGFYWPVVFIYYIMLWPVPAFFNLFLIVGAAIFSIKPEHYYDVDMLESIKTDTSIKSGDCISPSRGAWMTDDEFGLSEVHRKERAKIKVNDSDYADIRAMATKVHAGKFETVIKR